MKYSIQLFIQQHHSGYYTLTVLSEDDLVLFTDDLNRGREELQLLLSDRLERLHPRGLAQYASEANLRQLTVVLPEAIPVEKNEGEGEEPTKVTVLVTRDKRWHRLWLPRWELRYWLPVEDDVEEHALALLRELLPRYTPHQRLNLRTEGDERVEELEVDTERAPLGAFTDKLLGAAMLPEPSPEDEKKKRRGNKPEDEDDEDDEDDDEETEQEREREERRKRQGQKKRPPTPTLKRLATHLTQLARDEELERAHGRERELGDLVGLLGSGTGSAYVIVGESSVGKTTLLNELVYRVRQDSAPRNLRGRHVWFVDAHRLVAGDGFFGDWQRQCLDVVQECIDAEIIWYIGDLYALLDAGRSISSDQNVALLLKPFLGGKRLTVIGESTPRRWSQVEQRDIGFARMFTPFRLAEPAPEDTRRILKAVASDLHGDTDVKVTPLGLRTIEELCARFNADASRLGTAVHFLRRVVEDAATRAEREQTTAAPTGAEPTITVDRAEVVRRFCEESGMPAFLVQDDVPMDPEAVWAHFRARLIGQDEAVRRMTDLVAMIKAGLSDLRRPLGSFLFVGPTGVGKTEMVKALTEFLFGRPDRMIRYDMSEFVSADSVHRFIGSGGREGHLISQIRRSPFCVLLLDEIEKAHPAVFDVLLQLLGEARLTDQAGRTADFRNTVVLMTSNLGVETFRARPGFGSDAAAAFRQHFEDEARRFFRPELLNRIDVIVPFSPLGDEAIARITRREVGRFLQREGLRQRKLDLRLDDAVPGWLARHGVDVRYGARPLKRLIERALTAPLARHISSHDARAVRVDIQSETPGFHTLPVPRSLARQSQETDRFLQRVSDVRYQVQRWLRCEPMIEIEHQIRLIDRLAQDKAFWKDPSWAQQRIAECQRPRDLLLSVQDIYGQAASLEDLAFELHHARNAEDLALLQSDLDAIVTRLDQIELEILATRYRSPLAIDLLIHPSTGAEGLLREILTVYLTLGEEHGWTFRAQVAVEDPQALADRAARVAEKTERGTPAPRKDRSASRDDLWTWSRCTTPLTPRREDEDDNKLKSRQSAFITWCLAKNINNIRHIRVEGPFACMLHAEEGVHTQIVDSSSPQLAIATLDRTNDALPSPVAARELIPRKRRRLIHTTRRIVQDPLLELQTQLEGNLARVYPRFIRAALYDTVFGAGAWRQFRRE